jgi:hypothetical protein
MYVISFNWRTYLGIHILLPAFFIGPCISFTVMLMLMWPMPLDTRYRYRYLPLPAIFYPQHPSTNRDGRVSWATAPPSINLNPYNSPLSHLEGRQLAAVVVLRLLSTSTPPSPSSMSTVTNPLVCTESKLGP